MRSRDTDNNLSHRVRFREVFVGELGPNGALHWGGDPDDGNVPARIGPVFPRTGAVANPFDVVIDWLRRGRASGRRVDWALLPLSLPAMTCARSQSTATDANGCRAH